MLFASKTRKWPEVRHLAKLYGNAKLVKGFRIDVDDGRSHAVCLDLPRETGTDLGTSALELALMSYAGCYATIFALTAEKMRIALKGLDVNTEAIKSQAEGTITEVSFDIAVNADAPKDRIQRVHELTVKNCPVGKIFDKAGVKTAYNLQTAR
jgi:uncharacterized OsmC-like protein